MDVEPRLSDLTIDTAIKAAAVQLSCLRRISPQERLQTGCRMTQRGRRFAIDAIRRRHPEADDMEIRLRSIELAHGAGLAADVRHWLQNRIG